MKRSASSIKDGILKDGHAWLEGLDARNNTIHIHDEAKVDQVVKNIKTKYTVIISDLYALLKKEL